MPVVIRVQSPWMAAMPATRFMACVISAGVPLMANVASRPRHPALKYTDAVALVPPFSPSASSTAGA